MSDFAVLAEGFIFGGMSQAIEASYYCVSKEPIGSWRDGILLISDKPHEETYSRIF